VKKYLFYITQNYSFAILRPLQERLRQQGDEVYWFFESDDVDPQYLRPAEKRWERVQQINKYRPDVVVATANSIPDFLPGLKVCVFHGFDAGKRKPSGEKSHFRIRGCFDLYCTQGPNTTRVFRQKQQQLGYFNVIETGWPALDPLFSSTPGRASEKPTILFCSTFSRRLSAAPRLVDTIDRISRRGNWHWLVQFHPKMPQKTVDRYRQMQHEHLEFIETDNIIPLLQQADIMLSDTSSVISMFLVQHKPVVTFRNIEPAPYLIDVTREEEIQPALETALTRPPELVDSIREHVDLLHPYRDGRSSQRVIEAIEETLQGRHPVSARKPLNLIRNIKYRKRLGYWLP